jgi:Ca2+/H+ antiporter
LEISSFLHGQRFRPPHATAFPLSPFARLATLGIVGQISGDGESNWLEGVQLLSVYIVPGILFFFLPEAKEHAANALSGGGH